MKSNTTQALDSREPAPDRTRSVLFADSEMLCFCLIVTPTKCSFYVRSLVNGKQVCTKQGDHRSMGVKQVHDDTCRTLVDMRAGENLHK